MFFFSDCGHVGFDTMKVENSMFFRNVGVRLKDNTVSQSEQSKALKPQNVFRFYLKL